jgi:hypothetical protein
MNAPQTLIAYVVLGLLLSAAGKSVFGQDEVDQELPENFAAARAEKLSRLLFDQQQTLLRLRTAYKARFERWPFSQFGTRGGARQQLEVRLAGRLLGLAAECHLREDQVAKLRLAGQGDIKRCVDRLDAIAGTLDDSQSSVDEMREAMLCMTELGLAAGDRLFGDQSLLGKTLVRTLDPDQSAERQQALARTNKRRHEAALASAVGTLRKNLALTDEQWSRLAALLARETDPPRKFGNAPDIALVLYQASRIPEEKIRPIFTRGQWQTLSRWMSIYIGGASGGKTLEKYGFVFDSGPHAGTTDALGISDTLGTIKRPDANHPLLPRPLR